VPKRGNGRGPRPVKKMEENKTEWKVVNSQGGEKAIVKARVAVSLFGDIRLSEKIVVERLLHREFWFVTRH